jgi:hypothetical protein
MYDFQAVEHEQENRQFVVTVRNTVFLATALKYQHGAEICLLRVQRALLEETTGAHASQKLEVLATDVHEYFEHGKPGRRPRANRRSDWAVQRRVA